MSKSKWTVCVLAEEGAALVEMAISISLLLSALFGILTCCLGLYISNTVAEASKEASRYASIRGTLSCTYATSPFPNCNLGPTTAGNAIQDYVQSLGYPFSKGLIAKAYWYAPTSVGTWTSPCTSATDSDVNSFYNGTACNYPGHAVQVQVVYQFPFNVPFVPKESLNIGSKSQMVISE